MLVEDVTSPARSLAAYAALVRLPNLFTAPPDVVCGAALVAAAGASVAPATVAGLALASVSLYAGGTTLNDAFDAPEDALSRPERPIPSGRVTRRRAFVLGAALLFAGPALAGVATGAVGAGVAAALALVVVLYDGLLKGGAVGFLAMGLTRGLNVVLGTTVVGAPIAEFGLHPSSWFVPLVVVGYIAAVTYMAARETSGGNRAAVAIAGAAALLASLAVVGHLLVVRPPATETVLALALAVAFVWWTGRALRSAYANPVPETVGPAVGACVLGLVVLDAGFAAATGVGWALVALAFLAPALSLARLFDVS